MQVFRFQQGFDILALGIDFTKECKVVHFLNAKSCSHMF